MENNNPHFGSTLDDLLKEDGLLESVRTVAIKRTFALQIEGEMKAQNISKAEMARRMKTSATQLQRLLDPNHDRIQIDTLAKAAGAVGKSLNIELV